MKKKSLKNLMLNKKIISTLQFQNIKGGKLVTEYWWMCPQNTDACSEPILCHSIECSSRLCEDESIKICHLG